MRQIIPTDFPASSSPIRVIEFHEMRSMTQTLPPQDPGGSQGFSLLEALIGLVLLAFLLTGATLFTRSFVASNTKSRALVDMSTALRSYVEEIKGMDIATLPRNQEVADVAGDYRITWVAYDSASGPPYRQPAGLVLLCVKAVRTDAGVDHILETTTLLGPP